MNNGRPSAQLMADTNIYPLSNFDFVFNSHFPRGQETTIHGELLLQKWNINAHNDREFVPSQIVLK